MKYIFKSALLLSLLLAASSCVLDEIDSQPASEPRLECDALEAYTIQATKPQAVSFRVNATTPWTVTASPEVKWITITPASSAVSSLSEDVRVTVAANTDFADLHQMRGRVGRSNKKAFCYLMAPPLGALPQDARRRLQAIENFSDLGSGIHIAMQDLDIRGAGNLLGAEQSGFIADLGYETYQKILSEAVKELKNEEFKDLFAQQVASGEVTGGEDFVDECQLESDIQMSFPESFVPGSTERMLLYRELDGLETDEAVEAFRKRLVDRFGPIPEQAEELIRVVVLRRLGKHFGAERVMLKNGRMRLYFLKDEASPFFQSPVFGQCIAYGTTHVLDCRFDEVKGRRSMLIMGVDSVGKACEILEEMKTLSA